MGNDAKLYCHKYLSSDCFIDTKVEEIKYGFGHLFALGNQARALHLHAKVINEIMIGEYKI